MLEFILALAFVGAFNLVLSVGYFTFVVFMYVVDRCNNGKLSFIDYIKYW